MNLIEELESQIKVLVDEVVILEDSLLELETSIQKKNVQLHKLGLAYNALTGKLGYEDPRTEESVGIPEKQNPLGNVQSQPSPVPARSDSQRLDLGRPVSGPPCQACGGELERSVRPLANGRVIQLWACKDSGCNNEVIAA